MGLADAFGAEDRVPVMVSEYRKLIKTKVEADVLKNALAMGMTYEQAMRVFTGAADELSKYRDTGLTPEQMREIDHLYSEKCVELAMTAAERDLLQKQLEDLKAVLREAVGCECATRSNREKPGDKVEG